MILPPICGAIQTFRDGLEFRYVCSFLGLAGQWAQIRNAGCHPSVLLVELEFNVLSGLCAAVGVGSWCFHMTLLYEMQVGYDLCMLANRVNVPMLC